MSLLRDVKSLNQHNKVLLYLKYHAMYGYH